jgi:hypothetical protein
MEVIQVAPIQVGIWTVQIIYPLLGKWPMWVRSGWASYSTELSVLGQTRASPNGGPMFGFTSKADPISPSPYVS